MHKFIHIPPLPKRYTYFYVDSYGGWMIVSARTNREARSAGIREFGRGMVKSVKIAKAEDVQYYINLKGSTDKAENV